MADRSLYSMFQETVESYGARRALGFKTGKESDYTYWTYGDLDQRVRAVRRGLDALGLRVGDRIALLSENRAEWVLVDLASQALGVVTVPIYPSLPAVQIAQILRDSGSRALVLSDAKQRAKVPDVRPLAPDLEIVISMETESTELESADIRSLAGVVVFGEERGRDEAVLDDVTAGVDPAALATLIYTSGTTGDPKGAMLSHRNLLQTPDAVVDEPIADLGPDDVFLSFLPLSHITERVGGYYLPLRIGACIVYSQGVAAVADEIRRTVRPTLMLCVPRLFESMHGKANDEVAKLPTRKQRLVRWAIAVGERAVLRRLDGRMIPPLLALQHIAAEKMVLSTLRAKITGGNMRYLVSGGAPLDPDVARFFLGIGVELLEGYGLSETNIISINRPGRQRIGTVGTPLRNVELMFAADGEILMRGTGRMVGYFGKDGETVESIDSEGWLHTGDVGKASPDGYLTITDRKKDLIVLTNGKKVAPQAIESKLKHSSYIAEAVLFGDKQSVIVGLIVPNVDALLAWAEPKGLPTNDIPDLVTHPDVLKLYRSEIDRFSSDLADYEKVRRFKLVPREFSIDTGELTPTLKVKRRFVGEKYANLLAAIVR